MKSRLIAILLILCASSNAWAQPFGMSRQYYVITDKDGYTNIREKPTTNSKIIGKVVKYEVFFESDYFCGWEADGDIDLNTIPPNWAPVRKGAEHPVGYVYKANVMSFRDMESLQSNFREFGGPDTITSSTGKLEVSLILKPFDFENHKFELVNKNGIVYTSIDGEYPKGMLIYEFTKESCAVVREIKELIINTPEKKYSLPVDVFKSYFNPTWMTVFTGPENELYISIQFGMDGEAYLVMLSVVNGEIIYFKETDDC